MDNNKGINTVKEYIKNAEKKINIDSSKEADSLLLKALEDSEAIDDIFDKDDILYSLSRMFVKNKNCINGKETAENIWDEHIKIEALCFVLEECSRTKKENEELLSNILKLAQHFDNKQDRTNIYSRLLSYHLKKNRPDKAFSLIKYFDNKLTRIEKLCDIVVKYHELGLNDETEKLFTMVSVQAKETVGVEQKSKALAFIENAHILLNEHTVTNSKTESYKNILTVNKLLKNSLNILDTIENEKYCRDGGVKRGIPLCNVAEVYIKLEEYDKALHLTEEAKKLICTDYDGEYSCSLLYRISILYLHMNMLDEAVTFLGRECGRKNGNAIYNEFIGECIKLNMLTEILEYMNYHDLFPNRSYNESFHENIITYFLEGKQYAQALELSLKADDNKSKYKKLFYIANTYIQEISSMKNPDKYPPFSNEYSIHDILNMLEKLCKKDELHQVAELYSLIGEKEKSNDILDKSLIGASDYGWEHIAKVYIENEKVSKAIELYEKIKSSNVSHGADRVLKNIAKMYISRNEYDKALKITKKISSFDKTAVLSELIYTYAKNNQINRILDLIEDASYSLDGNVASKTINILAKVTSKQHIQQILEVMLKKENNSNSQGSGAVHNLALKWYMQNGEESKALKIAQSPHKKNNSNDYSLNIISRELISQGKYDDALNLSHTKKEKEELLYSIAVKHTIDGNFLTALEISNTFDKSRKGYLLVEVARGYYEKNKIRTALKLLKEVPAGHSLNKLDLDIFNYFLEQQSYENAFDVIDLIYYKDEALRLLAVELVKNNCIDEGFNMIKKINDPAHQIMFSTEIARNILDNTLSS